MRRVEQPGPVGSKRVQILPTRVRAVQVRLPVGVTILQGLANVVREQGAMSAVFSLREGVLSPLAFVMPALSDSPRHVAYYSQRFESRGPARLESGSITLGERDGVPLTHCHAAWTDAQGLGCGHLLPGDSVVEQPVLLDAWMLYGAIFIAAFDPETNFTILQVTDGSDTCFGADALAIRVGPNEDLCTALEQLCADRGIQRARIRGGVGSLIGAVFEGGQIVEPFITEVYIRRGVIESVQDGPPIAQVDVRLVTYTGEIAAGRLVRGSNPVLITFELVLEIEEFSSAARRAS